MRHQQPDQRGGDAGGGNRDEGHRPEIGFQDRGGRDGERRGHDERVDDQQRHRQANGAPWGSAARRLQQCEPAGRRPAEPGQDAGRARHWPAQGLPDREHSHQRAGHDEQAGLLERRDEAQAEGLADRLEGHVGGDAVPCHHRHQCEEYRYAEALDEKHEGDDGNRQQEGGEDHAARP